MAFCATRPVGGVEGDDLHSSGIGCGEHSFPA